MKNILEKFKFSMEEKSREIAEHGRLIFGVVAVTFIVMVAVCVSVFFIFVHGAEKVLVPNVVGKSLTDALFEMQAKELYPKLQMRYSDVPGDKGTIIDQNPKSGAIVKAYRRITITVSRGVPIDFIEDYIGKNADEVRNSIELLFSGEEPLVEIAPFAYVKDESAAGTVIAQFPPAGTDLSEKVKLQLIVSSGTETEKVSMPKIEGLSIKELYPVINENKIILDFEASEDESAPAAGRVSSVEVGKGNVEVYSRIRTVISLKPRDEKSERVQGIFKAEMMEYPYPVSVKLVASSPDGKTETLVDLNHPGFEFTVPYDVKKNTTLILYVLGEEKGRVVVE